MGSVMESDGQLECHGGRHREKPGEKRTADPKTLTQKREYVFRVTVSNSSLAVLGCRLLEGSRRKGGNTTAPNGPQSRVRKEVSHLSPSSRASLKGPSAWARGQLSPDTEKVSARFQTTCGAGTGSSRRGAEQEGQTWALEARGCPGLPRW